MKIFLCIVFLSNIVTVFCDWHHDVQSTILTQSNYLQFIGSEKHTFVDFFTPWCGACRTFGPEWSKIYQIYKDSNQVVIAKVNCDDQQQICKKYNVEKYPSIYYFPPQNPNKYVKCGIQFKDRNAQSVLNWIEELINENQFDQPNEEEEGEDCQIVYDIVVHDEINYEEQQWVFDLEDDEPVIQYEILELNFDVKKEFEINANQLKTMKQIHDGQMKSQQNQIKEIEILKSLRKEKLEQLKKIRNQNKEGQQEDNKAKPKKINYEHAFYSFLAGLFGTQILVYILVRNN